MPLVCTLRITPAKRNMSLMVNPDSVTMSVCNDVMIARATLGL